MGPGTRRWLAGFAVAVSVLSGCSSTNRKSSDASATAGDLAPGAAETIPDAPGRSGLTPEAGPAGPGAAPAAAGESGDGGSGPTPSGSAPRAGTAGGPDDGAVPSASAAGDGGPSAGGRGSGGGGGGGGGKAPGGAGPAGTAPPREAAAPGPVPGQPAPAPPRLLGPESGPGFTASTINIGITLIDETASRGAGLIGAKNTDFGDTRRQAQSLVDHVNANGGIAGRKVVPVYHTINIISETWDASAQGACSTFTEDNKTVAGISAVLQLSEVFPHCLARHHTIAVVNGRGLRDDRMIDALGNFLAMPSRVSVTRFAALNVDGLADLGYFDAGAKVGLIRFDTATLNRAVAEVMKPRLSARKVAVVADEAVSHPDSVNGFGATSAQISNAVLRMRSAGVTHVLPVDDHGIMMYLLLPQAESQGFRPRYGVTTNNQPFVLEENAPKEQLKGMVGAGWLPADDVAAPRAPDNPGEQVCAGVLDRAGAKTPSRYAYSNALNYCDSLLFLQAVFSRAPSLTPAGFRAGMASLGASYASPYAFATDFGRDRIDGAAAWRALRYHPDCGCLRYEGGNRPF